MKTNKTYMLSVNKVFRVALLSLGLLALFGSAVTAGGTPREKLNINPVWRFTLGDPADASKPDFDDCGWDLVSLPHSHDLHAADLSNFRGKDEVKEPYVAFLGRKVGWYRRTIDIPATALSGKVFLVFRGAMETTRLWVNGKPAGECLVGGYTSFHFDITPLLQSGKNGLSVRVDNTVQKDMYDYNTPHYGAPYFQAPHGVCDIFRIPKLSYYWHCAELGKEPITYLYPIKDDKIVIFSNAEKVRYSESIGGKDFKEVGVLEPDKGFALNHPPFHATVSNWTTCYKAEGLVNGKVVSSHIYHRQSEPAALKHSVDHSEITADGGDMTGVLLQLVDKNGTVIVNNYEPVSFSIEGAGLLVGENPTQLMAGQCIILVRSTFEPCKMTIGAEMPGMEGIGKASVTLKTVAVAANAHVDMPKTTVNAPTGITVMPTNLKQIQVNLPADDFGWFVIPVVENAEPGQLVESKPMLVSGQRQTSKLTVRGCEYRIYSSAWSSAPTEVTRGDALFFRMKANPAAGQTATAEVTIQGVKRTFTVKTK